MELILTKVNKCLKLNINFKVNIFLIIRFRQFLKDVSKIPLSVGEYDSAEKNEVEIFEESDKINVNDFLETMMSDPGPQCLSW